MTSLSYGERVREAGVRDESTHVPRVIDSQNTRSHGERVRGATSINAPTGGTR